MTVMVDAEQEHRITDLLDAIDTPEGWRVEYIEEGIIVTPPAGPYHESILTNLLYQLIPGVAFVLQAGRGYCLDAGSEKHTGDHVIPDLAIGSRAFSPEEMARSAETHSGWLPADALAVVFEVTSSNRRTDVRDKLVAYGRMGIPHYVLIDRATGTVVVHSDPTGDCDSPGYASKKTTKFGHDVQLPAPYPVLETKTWQ
ncbi:Uma2 family endonuclease [Yinghuangia seranimata]|uniref:Uma2 family endonuclease n=1 Tax=Yinghuangia seranimata TaxID=408067 RepID=UPI00248C374C|nr:Uma2 family endonuclease [Yinghuangia seranimata]MDI2126818.1 Uma2 family endonuclease [Yinghuangia seranimata]